MLCKHFTQMTSKKIQKQPPEVFYEKGCSQKFHKIHRKATVPESLFLKTLLKKRLWHKYFPVNFVKFLKTPFLQNTSGRLLLKIGLLEVNTCILNNSEEYAELNSTKKTSKEGKNLLFSGNVISVKFNLITSSLKYCFVKGVVIPQTHLNENPYCVQVCVHDDGSILTGECG